MKLMILDDVQSVAPELGRDLVAGLNEAFLAQHPRAMAAQRELMRWQGGHALGETAPVIYYAWLYHLIEMTMADELGEADFAAILPNFLLKRSYPVLLRQAESPWWDDVTTPDVVETRAEILGEAFVKALAEIEAELGPDMTAWEWGKVHQAVHPHVMGQQPPFDLLFNVGPIPVAGGNEVLNNTGFKLQPGAMNRSIYGPSRRTVIDFAAVSQSWSILPTGNSGHRLSPHYADQAELYHAGKFRPVWLERGAVEKAGRRLWLVGE
jgi:penicillin amidase